MNFVSHLALAQAVRRDAGFLLGAMLPDFASMAGVRIRPDGLVDGGLAEVSAGVHHHLRVDDIFHGHPQFLALMAVCVDQLTLAGVPRGPARAAAHVGVELLLDGELGHDPAMVAAYVRTVAWGAQAAAEWSFHAARPLAGLLSRLHRHGFPHEYASPEAVAARVVGMFAARPRLALSPANAPYLVGVLRDAQVDVRACVAWLFRDLQHALAIGDAGHNEPSRC
ncbi:MAG: hypothetical protein RL385_3471 [Pseudomonadota bacterium]